MIITEVLKLLERNPNLASYASLEDLINKYKDIPDMYVHFSTPFNSGDTKVKMFKAGFNPKQNWRNPYGFYCYPVKNMSKFRTDQPMAYFVKRVKDNYRQIDKIDEMSQIEYVRCTNIIKSKILEKFTELEFINILKKSEQDAVTKSDGAILFYFIVRLSDNVIGRTLFPNNRLNVIQYKIWKDWLGYSFIGDLNGRGIIHSNEPFQVLFLTLTSFKVVDNTNVKKHLSTDNDSEDNEYEFRQKNYYKLKMFNIKTFEEKKAFILKNFEGVLDVKVINRDDIIVYGDKITFNNDNEVEVLPFEISKIICDDFSIYSDDNPIKSFKNFPEEFNCEHFEMVSGNFKDLKQLPILNSENVNITKGYKSIEGIEHRTFNNLELKIREDDLKFMPKLITGNLIVWSGIPHLDLSKINFKKSLQVISHGKVEFVKLPRIINGNLILTVYNLNAIYDVEIVHGIVDLTDCDKINLKRISIRQCKEIKFSEYIDNHTKEELQAFKQEVETIGELGQSKTLEQDIQQFLPDWINSTHESRISWKQETDNTFKNSFPNGKLLTFIDDDLLWQIYDTKRYDIGVNRKDIHNIEIYLKFKKTLDDFEVAKLSFPDFERYNGKDYRPGLGRIIGEDDRDIKVEIIPKMSMKEWEALK